jgi:TolB-like protein
MRHSLIRAFTFMTLIGFGLSAAPLVQADPLDTIADHLAKGATKLSSRKIAVLAFSYPDGGISSGSSLVAEGLMSRLVGRKGISVIERSQLAKLLSETKLELSGVTESSGTQKLGQILGVDAIVTGTLVDLRQNQTTVNARLIGSATGEVLAAITEQIDRTWEDAPRQPPSATQTTDKGETRYMSPLIPVSRGSNAPAPPPRRRRVNYDDY